MVIKMGNKLQNKPQNEHKQKNKLKDKLKQISKYQIMIMIIMLLSAMLLIYLTALKEGMHLDEYLTYGLANHEADGSNKITPEFGVRVSANDVFDTFFYPDGFSIKNVWVNQGNNVHPPFYYLIFHIFTLLTHSFLALKTGVLLNIIFHTINIVLVWLIIKEMLHNENEALLGALLYAFMPIILGNVIFIRMYMLMTTYVLAVTLLFIKGWNKEERKAFYVKLGIISVCGTLTHYYFLIYLFYCCAVWGISLLIKRKWKEIAVFVGVMCVSGAACLAIFPYMIEQLFTGAAGERTLKNLLSPAFLGNIKNFIQAIDKVYGGFLPAVVIIALILLVFRLVFGRENGIKGGKVSADGAEENSVNADGVDEGEVKQGGMGRWLIILIPCVLYFLTITWIAIMAATRYISPVYPICIVLLMGLFDMLASYVNADYKVRCVAGILLAAVLLNGGWKAYTWSELYLEAEDCVSTARKYGVNNECIYVLNVTWHSFPAYQEFIQYQNMTFIRDSRLDLLFNENYSDYDHVMMYFDNYVSEEKVEEILGEMIEMNPGLEGYEKMHTYMYNTAYYLD